MTITPPDLTAETDPATASLPIDYQPPLADRPLPVRYMPQLDALCALAVFAVWIEHWGIKERRGFNLIPWGQLGVWLFFVLSGFLITGILLRAKEGVERSRSAGAGNGGGDTLWGATKNFYARRFLRILPIYYLALFATIFLLHIPDMRHLFWWHLTYTTNIRVAFSDSLGKFPDQGGIHFWTLAVEEQFYLLWPALILLVPRRHLVKTIFITLAGGVAFRAVCVAVGQGGAAGTLPFSCFDLFAYGAALAAFNADHRLADLSRRFRFACLVVGGPAFLLLLALRRPRTRRIILPTR